MIMVSTTRVITHGLPRITQVEIMAFWIMAIFSGTTSRPRLPRETMTPSDAEQMERKLKSACRVSHLAMI